MSESERAHFDATAPARAAELIADFMGRHDAWRREAHDLARRREQVRVAAEREAADLLTKARADIGRTLVETRRELLALATQLRAAYGPLTEVDGQAEAPPDELTHPAAMPAADWTTTPESVAQARRDLQRVLAKAQPELDELAALSRSFGSPSRTPEPDNPSDFGLQTSDFRLQTSGFSKDPFPRKGETAPAAAASWPSHASPAAPQPAVTFADPWMTGSGHSKRLLTVLALIGAALVATVTGWCMAVSTDGGERRTPVAVAPTVTPKPPAMAAPGPRPAAIATPATSRPEPAQASAASNRPISLWLVIEARRAAWIQVTTDGRADQGRVFRDGETRRILGTRSISIVVGDAGAVTLSLNGGKATALGRDGQVVTRRFTIEDAARLASSQTRSGTSGALPTGGTDAANEDARAEILTLSQRWLDGYYRGDNNTMAYVAVPDASITDERQVNKRLAFGLTQVDRTFDQMHFEQRGDTAVLAARMTEQADMRGYTTQVVSVVSERLRRHANRWRLADVRILSETK